MRLFSAIVLAAVSFTTMASQPVSNIVIFGDSLSDKGNLYEYMEHQIPPSPPYFEGRFSNGPIWIEQLINLYYPNKPQLHLFDYAFGGAIVAGKNDEDTVFSLQHEIERYLSIHKDSAQNDSLFMMWIGANNYLGIPEDADKIIAEVNQGISDSLDNLAKKGAKHIVVISLPDLGRLPFAIEFGFEQQLSYFSEAHNLLLTKTVEDMKVKYPDVQWLYFDVNKMLYDEINYPERYGFNDVRTPCYKPDNNSGQPQSLMEMVENTQPQQSTMDCKGYLFFDLVHPTEAAHRLMTLKLRHFLDDAGVEFIG